MTVGNENRVDIQQPCFTYCFNQLLTLLLSQHFRHVDWKHKLWLETTAQQSYFTVYLCICLCLRCCLRGRGRSVPCLCPTHKVMWWGLVRGRSEAERATLMWVKAIDRGPAQHHADSDLIAALQNLKARETSGVKTALLSASWRLWVSSGIASHSL